MINYPEFHNKEIPQYIEMVKQHIDSINEAIGNIEISSREERTLQWLCGYEPSTVQNIVSVIKKSRSADRQAVKQAGNYI